MAICFDLPCLSTRTLFRTVCTGMTALLLANCAQVHGDGPTLKRLFPAGAQRGNTAEVAALGDATKWPVHVWSDDAGIQWEPLADKGKFKVTVAADVRLGPHGVRFYDEESATDRLTFIIGHIGEVNEVEPNDSAVKAQSVSELPKLINGVLEKQSEVDTFAVDLLQGQALIASIQAEQGLGSPMDATLQIVSASGTVLAQNLDTIGLDPQIHYVASRAGRYLVRVFAFPGTPDGTISFAGGESFVYRLTLAHAGLLQGSLPLAVSTSNETTLALSGIGLGAVSSTVSPLPGAKKSVHRLTVDGSMNSIELPIVDVPILVEQVPSSDQVHQELPIPSSISGRLSQSQEVDRYRFLAKKDTKLHLQLHAREFGFPIDGVLTILDSQGKQLVREDDAENRADSRAVWQPPADGEYVLEVSDAFNGGGALYLYRVDLRLAVSDVRTTLKADRFQGQVGQPLEIAVSIERRDGFAHPLSVVVTGLPDTIQCPVVVSEKEGATAKDVTLKVTASAPFSGPIQIVAKNDADPASHFVASAGTDSARTESIWLTIKP